jgi:rhodanese-related sulfurtransferase
MRHALKALFATLVLGGAAAPAVLAEPPAAQKAAVKTVSSETFSKNPEGALLIDVREPKEWTETGMPATAKGVSISQSDFVQRILAETGGDKTKPVAVICRSGTRSAKAAQQLADAGFTNVTNVGDGMIGREGVGQGWLSAKLPTKAYTADQR